MSPGVPTLLEYMNIYTCSKFTFSTTSKVSSKSSSVSPGKPRIMSVDSSKFGIFDFIFSTKFRYCSLVYFLFIFFKTSVLPDWSGKWIILHTFSQSLIASITSSEKSFGCGEINLILSIPDILFTALNNSENFVIPKLPFPLYELTFCPNKVISLYPSFANSSTSFIISCGSLLLSLPRTYGTMQYVQKLLQPFIIVTDAFILSFLLIGSPSIISPSISNISCIFSLLQITLYKSSGNLCIVCVPNRISTKW